GIAGGVVMALGHRVLNRETMTGFGDTPLSAMRASAWETQASEGTVARMEFPAMKRCASKLKKKKALSFQIGPPMEPPKLWFRSLPSSPKGEGLAKSSL